MAITLKPGRQMAEVALVDFKLADLTSGTAAHAVQLPPNARVVEAYLRIDTAFNSGTSDALVVQSDEGTPKAYISITAGSGAVAVGTYVNATGASANQLFKNPAQSYIDIKWTGVGTAATTGAGTLVIKYVVDGREQWTQG